MTYHLQPNGRPVTACGIVLTPKRKRLMDVRPPETFVAGSVRGRCNYCDEVRAKETFG